MTKQEAKKRIAKLRKEINYHRYLYHVLDRQEISDAALDSLKHELYKLEQQFPEFITPDSPTQRVGGEPLEKFKKVKHKVPMLSIEDIFSKEELADWEDYLKRLIPSAKFEYFSELKIDGFAITLVYKNGILDYGATRGNGRVGEDVTQNLKTIESIPLKLTIHGKLPNEKIANTLKKLINEGKIEIRGEVYMEKKAFEEFNKQLEKKGEKPYSNPRNLAAGSIRQLDPKLAASRPLKFLAYDIITDLGQKKHSEEHQILPVLGFRTNQGKKCKNLEEAVDFWQEVAKRRERLPFQIDGVVIIVDDNLLFKKLGVVGKSPRGIRAFKFTPEEATTQVLDIKVQVGRTGALTPVAVLKPVQVGGVTVSHATLHNEDEIKRLGVKIGDTVIVQRAGDVIPDIVKVLPNLRTGKEKEFQMPKKCPICGSKTIRKPGEAVTYCSNKNCYAQQRQRIIHFISKPAFDIDGLGPKIIDQLLQNKLISDPADIFLLKEGDLIPLERFAEKSASNLIKAIRARKEIDLARFIYALGIRHVGEETAELLALTFGSLERLKKASLEEIESIYDIGEVVAKSIYDYFRDKKNLAFIDKLLKLKVIIKNPQVRKKKTPLSGKTFVLTGTLEAMTRQEAKEKIKSLGGRVSSSVSKNTDFVVVGKEPGSKYEKAKKLKVKMLNEKEFLELIG